MLLDIERAEELRQMRVIDLFAGCGGLSLGFIQAGYDISQAVEFDSVIANTYQLNHPEVDMIVDDIKNIDTSGIFKCSGADIIIGGPPCQGFSMAGARIRRGFIDDPRNYLFKHYFNVVKDVRPKVFIMENVKGIATMQGGKIFNEIQRLFQDSDVLGGKSYHTYHRLINAADFGIPQRRERMIILGTLIKDVDMEMLWTKTKEDILQEFPTYFDNVTVRDAIGNLPMTTTDGIIQNPAPETEYEKYLYCNTKTITNHTMSHHSKIAVERMKQIKNGENYTVLNERINSIHSGSYGRLSWQL